MGQSVSQANVELLQRSSEVDFPEFLEHLSGVIDDPCPSEPQLRKAFKAFDQKDKGFVSFAEMEYAVNRFMSKGDDGDHQSRKHSTMSVKEEPVVTVSELEDMFAVVNQSQNDKKNVDPRPETEAEPTPSEEVGEESEQTITAEDFISIMKIIF